MDFVEGRADGHGWLLYVSVLLLLLLLLLLLFIIYLQATSNYITEACNVSMVYTVAAVLCCQLWHV